MQPRLIYNVGKYFKAGVMRKSVFNTILITLITVLLSIPFLSCAPAERNYELTRLTISQPLDHDDPGGAYFDQELFILVPHNAPNSSPVFFILGNEHDLTNQELVKTWNAYGAPSDVIFIQAEHRGYGQSVSADDNQTVPLYVTVDQALADLKVPLVYVCGGMDPWQGLGLEKDYKIAQGYYFYIPEGRHCPDLSNVEIGKQVLAEMLKYAK